MTQQDKQTVRELAKQYMEITCSEAQKAMNRRMHDTNDLKLVRPPVLIEEIPWYQMDIDCELVCRCEDERARAMEYELRKALYRRKYFKADTLFEPFWRVRMTVESTGNGLERKETLLKTDAQNSIVSHAMEDVLACEEALEKARVPEFSLRPDVDEDNMNFAMELLGDSMPVRLCGSNYVYFMPWDDISFLRGMEPILYDLYDRPEYLHRIMKKLCDDMTARLDFIEKYAHVEKGPAAIHCTPGYVSGLAEDGWKATWFRGAAQPFSSVSPKMLDEFEIAHILPIARRFAYTYYGCCEPLHKKIRVIKQIPNLRKIGVSPWADIRSCAEQIGGSYVYSRKPNPANVAIRTDPALIRREIEDTVRVCQEFGCPCEFVLKDISTVSHRPENLIVWAQAVSDVLDAYYGTE